MNDETAHWQAAIDAASAAGGGVVSIPPGDHLSGQLVLKSGVTLQLEDGARLVGSGDPAVYRDLLPQRALPGFHATQTLGFKGLVLAENAENIALLGPGTLDGPGGAFPKVDSLGRRPTRRGTSSMSPDTPSPTALPPTSSTPPASATRSTNASRSGRCSKSSRALEEHGDRLLFLLGS